MNIETLTVEYIRTGRQAAEGILKDDALWRRLSDEVVMKMEKLRQRTCLPEDAIGLMEPTQQALEEERVAVQRQLDAMKEISRVQESTARRLTQLQMTKDVLLLFGGAIQELLDVIGAHALSKRLKDTGPIDATDWEPR